MVAVMRMPSRGAALAEIHHAAIIIRGVNLKPRRMAGQLSEAMLLDIGYADGITPVLAIPERLVPNGVRAG